jgi:hypothetical protein
MERITEKYIADRIEWFKQARIRNGKATWLQVHYYNGHCNLEEVNAEDEKAYTCQRHVFSGSKSECATFIAGAMFAS